MDSAIDTLSTTSEHSVASSIDSVQAINCASPRELESVSSSISTMNNTNDKRSSPHYTLNNNTAAAMNQMLMQQQSQQQTPPIGGGTPNGGGVSNRNRASSCSPPTMSPSRHPQPPSPAAAAAAALNHSMMQQMQQQHHQHSPPPNGGGLPAGMPPRMPHGLPPHSLGLLNSLQMMHHASPLELMAAAHHHVPPRSYNSPPPISTSDPSANECKLVEYRGQKVAAFIISGETMLCLPQAFELFLKHLVGGLHTVYTKLKRLDIVPLVCNVEQVRILRGLGAIQPGVNRCKLLSCKDFDVLYRDCTTARCLSIKPPESSRPGRPPKRGPVGLSLPPTHLSQHPQLKKHRMDNGDYAYENGHITDISRLEKSPLLANGYNPPPINHMAFMQMNHHPGSALMSPGMPPHGLHGRPDSQMLKAAAQSGMSAASMDAIARSGIWENCRAAYEDIVKHLERLRDERTDDRQQMNDPKPRDLSSRNCSPNRQSPVLNLSKSGGATDHGSNCDDRSDRSDEVHSPPPSVRGDDENLSDDNGSEVDDHLAKDDDLSDSERDISAQHQAISVTSNSGDRDLHHSHHSHHSAHSHHQPHQQSSTPHHHHHHQRALNYSTLAATAAAAAVAASGAGVVGGPGVGAGVVGGVVGVGGVVSGAVSSGAGSATGSTTSMGNGGGGGVSLNDGLPPNDSIVGLEQQSTSSTETLLRNIQSLLKVAADNARQQERQISYEKAELKMDVMREREVKDSLERQLVDERKLRVLYQKRYRRERKMRIRYQQQLDGKRKGQSVHGDDREGSKGLSDSGKNGQDIDCKASEKSDKSSTNDRRRRSESPTYKREPIDRDTRSSADRMDRERDRDRERERERERERDREHDRSSEREGSANQVSPLLPPTSQAESGLLVPGGGKTPWNYPGIDLMATGAFWQNYSESLVQELEMERKSRVANADRDVKSPLQDRQQSYYKNSVLFGSAT